MSSTLTFSPPWMPAMPSVMMFKQNGKPSYFGGDGNDLTLTVVP